MRNPTIKFYKDRRGEWRWSLKAANGRIIGCSSEGYKRRGMAVRNSNAVWNALAWVVEEK